MNKEEFERYVSVFNARDYETLHASFFAPDVRLQTLGYVLDGQDAIRRFYGFFHEYINEALAVVGFHSFAEDGFFAEIRMTLTANKAFTSEVAEANGFARLPAIPLGASYATTLFIKYRLKDGKFHRIWCAEMPDAPEGDMS